MHDTRPHHLGSLRQLMVALAVAALAMASPWPVEAQQRDLILSSLASNLSSDIPDLQTVGSRKLTLLDNDPSPELPYIRLDELKYKSGPLLAATEPKTHAATAAAGSKGKAGDSSLASTATNPIGNLIQFQLQNVFIPNSWDSSGYANQFFIQPVVPIKLHNDVFPILITRTTIPIVTTPDPKGPVSRTTGSGDIVFLTAFVNNQKWGMWGVGPTFTFPTASDSRTGSEKWQVGPTVVVFVTKFKPWQFGALVYSQHSFAGTSHRSTVSKLFWQPIVVRHFDKGWYAGLPDIASTINLRNGENTLNFTGLRVGKVTKIGKQPINVFLQPWYTPVHEGAAGKWNIKLNITFLFPQ